MRLIDGLEKTRPAAKTASAPALTNLANFIDRYPVLAACNRNNHLHAVTPRIT
jgi:hypothetical protein